mmetsp:Transcript_20115/g.34660  ORF Transcript_20115/g.34660 Transcript_20115/m.34660 type:complete len:85 (+) Transcript_20115:1237-1491(+)
MYAPMLAVQSTQNAKSSSSLVPFALVAMFVFDSSETGGCSHESFSFFMLSKEALFEERENLPSKEENISAIVVVERRNFMLLVS